MEFSKKGPMDPMNVYFSPLNGIESGSGIQFSLCETTTNLIFAHRVAESGRAPTACTRQRKHRTQQICSPKRCKNALQTMITFA